MTFSSVILAGGKSLRMGRDKAFLEVGGRTLLARQIQTARECGTSEVYISGRVDRDYSAFGCRVLQDKFSGAGPLSGIERALDAATAPMLLVLAVDLPAISSGFLRLLAAHASEKSGAIPTVAGNIEPLAAFYPKAAQPLAEMLLGAEENTVANFARHCVKCAQARFVELSASEACYFVNLNFPTDIPGC